MIHLSIFHSCSSRPFLTAGIPCLIASSANFGICLQNEALTGAMETLAKALFQILADKMVREYGIDPPWTPIAIKRRVREMSLADFPPAFAQLVKRQCDMPDPEEDESETDEESREVQYQSQYSGYAPVPTPAVYSHSNASHTQRMVQVAPQSLHDGLPA